MNIQVGDLVWVCRHEGSGVRIYRQGPEVRVLKIEPHVSVDGPEGTAQVARLSDGSWEFVWNLEKVKS